MMTDHDLAVIVAAGILLAVAGIVAATIVSAVCHLLPHILPW